MEANRNQRELFYRTARSQNNKMLKNAVRLKQHTAGLRVDQKPELKGSLICR